jgi:CBS domain containing-hemolysin-like protein
MRERLPKRRWCDARRGYHLCCPCPPTDNEVDTVLTAVGLLGVVVLIAANGYFVAVEFAFVAAKRSKFVEDVEDGDRRSQRALQVQKRLSFMLSGAQLGITVTTLVLGFVAEPAIAGIIEPVLEAAGVPESATFGISLTIALVLATMAQMVFGELAPKNLAIAKPEPIARALAPSTWFFMRVAGPIIRLFDGAANRLLRLIGVESIGELQGAVSAEELDLIVDSSAESGHLTVLQATLLERAIDFAQLEASDAMVPWNRVDTIEANATAADLRDLMATTHSRFPVLDDEGQIQGIVHAKDLLGVGRDTYGSTTVSSMAHDTLAVPEAAGLDVVLGELREHATEMAIVIDEYGGPAGVVTLEDIVEELVGEIEDEYDPSAPSEHVEVAPGVWSVAGTSRPDEIERVTGFELPDGEYDTVAGLVLDRLERIAEAGDSVVVDGVQIEVVSVDGYAIQEVRLEIDPNPPQDSPELDSSGEESDTPERNVSTKQDSDSESGGAR